MVSRSSLDPDPDTRTLKSGATNDLLQQHYEETGDNDTVSERDSLDELLYSFEVEDDEVPTDGGEGTGFRSKLVQQYCQFRDNHVKPNFGVLLLILSTFFNSIMVTTCKLLVTDKNFNVPIHPLQILFARMLITYMCCIMYMWVTKSVPEAPLGPVEIRKYLFLRGAVGFTGVFGLYYSLQYLSLSDAMAITFLIPMVTPFLAWIILHERYTLLEAVCGLVSLFGVVLIAKPNFMFGRAADGDNKNDDAIESSSTEKRILASAVGLLGVFGASSVYIILRKIGFNAHPLLSVSYFALTCVVVTFVAIIMIPSISFAIPQTLYQWFLFILIGLFGFLMQFSLTAGIQRVKAGKASLMSNVGMIFAIFWDLLIWHHFPGFLSVLGIFIIISNALIVIKYKPEEQDPEFKSQQARPMDKEQAVAGIALQEYPVSVGVSPENCVAVENSSTKDSVK